MPADPPDKRAEPDPESVEKWRELPQGERSRRALPPATGGLGISRALLIGLGLLALAAVVISLIAGR